ncbi:MAG: 2-succinyl-6-hydroxy-2,4-cyclohexadiene-1-carboxylate synthase [Phototrophicaceae bacterium]
MAFSDIQQITVNGVRYAYRTAGEGVPLVLLHGFTGSSASWSDVAESLSQRYRVIAPDLLGHGQTESPEDATRYSIGLAAQDLGDLLTLICDEPVLLLGYSMGGRLALYFALYFPQQVRALILESASPGLATQAERNARQHSDAALAASLLETGLETFINQWEALPLFETQQAVSPEVRQRLRDQRLQNSPNGLANSLRGMGTGMQPSLWPKLVELVPPTLLLTGLLDAKFTNIAQQMAEQLTDVKHHIIRAAGHTIHLEQPMQFVQSVNGFLADR